MFRTREIVAGDIGGTNARFCLAELDGEKIVSLSKAVKIKTEEHDSFAGAWAAFEAELGRKAPQEAAIAIAGPVHGDVLKLTNNPWVIRPAALKKELRLNTLRFVNDFGAVGHALSQLHPCDYQHLAGPQKDLPANGVITVLGPGTGLGVAHVLRRNGRAHVIEGEGGHAGFAPLDEFEDALLLRLRARHGRVSVERVVSGPAILEIYAAFAALQNIPPLYTKDTAVWQAGISGTDPLAAAAIQRFCLALGAVAGDYALIHGAEAVVIAGGIAPRLAALLPKTGFAQRFSAKGRFEAFLKNVPVKLIIHPDPGLLGAAVVATSTTG
ncbi:MAG: glucokinase [Rhodospirillales bacterium]|nr:glucokinase [Rhodospirillales bacterium]